MKQNKTLQKRMELVLYAFMVTLFLWCGNVNAAVVGTGTKDDPYVLENGESYSIESFSSFYAKFTAPSAGKFVLTGDSYSVYTDGTFSTIDGKIIPQFNNDFENKEYSFECEAGKTYYVGFDFAWDAYTTTFKFLTEAEPLQMKSCDPAEGTVMTVSSASVDLKFNQNVTVSSCTVSSGSNTATLTLNARDIYVSVDAKTELLNWYTDDKIKEGDDITFTFSGIATADGKQTYGEDGKFVVTYKAGPKPVVLVSSTNTPVSNPPVTIFKSYYMEDDYSSIINLAFSDNIKEVGSVTLEYGSREPVGGKDEIYIEELTPTVMANYVILDLKGKVRRVQDMLPDATNEYEYITLTLNGVRDNNGNLVVASDQSSAGKFVFNYKYQEMAYNVTSQIDEGNPITSDTKNVKLWITEDGGNAVFSGAQFAYKDNGEDKTATIEGSLLSYENDETFDGAKFIIVPVPNVNIDADTKVTLTLNAETPDGVAHTEFTKEINCTGKTADNTEFDVVSAIWHNGENDVEMKNGNIAVLTEGSKTTFTLNKEFGYCDWEITDNDGEYIRSGYYAVQTPVTSFDIEWFNEKFTQGKTYTFTLKAWNKESEQQGAGALPPTVGTATFTFNGAAEAYVYSDVELSNVIKGSVILDSSEQNTYVLKFSAPANVKEAMINTGSGTSVNCDVVANEDKKEWTVTLNSSVLNSFEAFDLNVFAEDMEGHAIIKAHSPSVEATILEDQSWLTIKFSAEFNRDDFSVSPASESTVESISKITFSHPVGISINWGSGATDKIVIRDREGYFTYGEFTKNDIKYDPSATNIREMWIELETPITDAGNYVVDIPTEFFVLGQDMMTSLSKHTLVYYEIKAASKDFKLEVNPAGGNVTEIPAIIEFTATELSALACNFDMAPTLKDANGNMYTVSFAYPEDWNKWNAIDVVLADGTITADGTYTLTIPAGALYNDSEGNYSNLEDIVIVYVIGTGTGIDSIVANAGGKVDVYTVNGVNVLRNADAAAVKALKKGLYIINGKKVVIK